MGSSSHKACIHLTNSTTSSSLLDIQKNINNNYFATNLKELTTRLIEINTLDNEIPTNASVNILKMDVQGYELEVLRGGSETLKRTAIIVLEVQNHNYYRNAPKYYELDTYLREHGFKLHDIIPSIYQEKKLFEFDSIYINNDFAK